MHNITILENERFIICADNGNQRHSDQLMAFMWLSASFVIPCSYFARKMIQPDIFTNLIPEFLGVVLKVRNRQKHCARGVGLLITQQPWESLLAIFMYT